MDANYHSAWWQSDVDKPAISGRSTCLHFQIEAAMRHSQDRGTACVHSFSQNEYSARALKAL